MTRPLRSDVTSVRTNGVDLGIESFGRADDPLVLLVGGTTMSCGISPPTRPRSSRRSVPGPPISVESASAGWSLRWPHWTTRTCSPH